MKHKVIQDFHLMSPDKNITTLKSGTIIEDWVYKKGSVEINVGKDAVEKNPQFFEIFDWKAELTAYLKSQKIPQPAVMSKKIQPFIQEFISTSTPSTSSDNSESLRTIDQLNRKLREKDIEIEELNTSLQQREKHDSREADIREKDLEFLKDQLEKKKARLDDFDFELENRLKDVKNREFELIALESRVSQIMSNLQEALDKVSTKESEISQPIVDESQIQMAQQAQRHWDGIYRGAH